MCCFKKLVIDKVQKKNYQLTLVKLSALFYLHLGDAGLGLAWHGPVQSNPILCCLVQCIMCKFKTTLHI